MRRGGSDGVESAAIFSSAIDLWPTLGPGRMPTLVLRGAESDLLLESTVRRMQVGGSARSNSLNSPGWDTRRG